MNFQEDISAVTNYLKNTNYQFTVGLDPDGGFADLYRVLGLPTHIFISADGRLNEVRVGGMTRAEMEQKVQELVSATGQTQAPAASPTATATALVSADQIKVGEALYNGQCLQCHGGQDGNPPNPKAPPHTNDGHTWHHADGQLLEIVLNGGAPYQGVMPPFRGVLSEDEITAILAYIKTWWGPEQRATQEEASRNWEAGH